eukprot:scaffold9760_cov69-Phaeocystis_antarctica.AAC.2
MATGRGHCNVRYVHINERTFAYSVSRVVIRTPLALPTHTASTVHHHAIVHGVVRKPRYQGSRGHSPTRAASRGLCVHHQAIVRAPAGLSYQAWQRSTSRQPRASLHSARSCASDMRRGPAPRGEEYGAR